MKRTVQGLFLVLLFATIANAQSLKLGPAVGFTAVQESGILSSEMPDLDNNMHYGLKAKLSLPVMPLTITGHVIYTSFEGSKDIISGGLIASGVNIETSLLSVGIGGEWALIPGPVKPYLAADFLISSFGDIDISYDGLSDAFDRTASGESRYGLGIGAGVDFKLLPTIDVDVSLKYNFNSLIGREDKEDNFNTINLTASFLFGVL